MTDRIASLPGYEILHRLSEGDTATIWLARQVSLDRLVAIKVLAPSLVRDAEARARFQAEARIAARINHPGIVQVYDAGEHEGLVYFIMEYVPGCTVSDLLKPGKPLSERNTLLIAQGVALALGYAWNEERLIHCDIKPDNLLIAEDGAVKVGDLGLARLVGHTVSLDSIEGTPYYCSPEQARGDSDLDCCTDIYALGATLYHMATGRIPFGDGPALDALRRQIEDYLPDPMDINTSLSQGFGWLVEKMMMKDRSVRYSDWSEVLTDIERVMNGEWPKEFPAAGQSTVLRSERRFIPTHAPPQAPAESHPRNADSATAEPSKGRKKPKLKIVMPADVRASQHGQRDAAAERDLGREWLYLFAAALTAVVVYGAVAVYYYILSSRDNRAITAPTPPQVSPQRIGPAIRPANPQEAATLLQSPTPQSKPPSPRLLESSDRRTSTSPSAASRPDAWTHPAYVRGGRLFNAALQQYKAYQRTRQNPSVLPQIERQCREAIQAFESIRDEAPEEVNIPALITQCYRLIEDVRQSTLVASAEQPRDELSAIVQETVEPPAVAMETDNLLLSPSWNNPQPDASQRIVNDLERLLQPLARPDVDLSADTSIVIFGQIFYLMPVREVARIMGKPQGIRRRITTPGFPKDSFFYYTQSGNFGNGFDTLQLITDSADRVVAVQLGSERSSSDLWLDPNTFRADISVYDLVEGKTKGNAKWKIAERAEKKNRVIEIDLELASHDPNGYFELGDSKSRKALFLPQPIADLILYRIAELKKTARPNGR